MYIRYMIKMLCIPLAIIVSLGSLRAQKIEKYLGRENTETTEDKALFYVTIEKVDSGWLKTTYNLFLKYLVSSGMYEDQDCTIANGFYYSFYPDKAVKQKGLYRNNKKTGNWIGIYHNGMMSDSAFYVDGNPQGYAMSWYKNGFPCDSTVYGEDGKAVEYAWFNDGAVSSGGRWNAMHQRTGKWQFYHHNGNVSAVEIYANGDLVERKYFSENGEPVTDTTDHSASASFPGGVSAWTRYIADYVRPDLPSPLTNRETDRIMFEFMVQPDGSVKDVELLTPRHDGSDWKVLQMMKRSPKWKPRVDHNRKTNDLMVQSININK